MQFAGVAAAAAAFHIFLGVTGNPVARENALPGSGGWGRSPASSQRVEAYTSETDLLPGEAVHFHVSTRERYMIKIYRLGWYGGVGGRLVACGPSPDCTRDEQGVAYPVPAPEPGTYRVVAGWPVTDTIRIPEDAASGYYLARIVLMSGVERGRAGTVPFVVRPPAGERSAVLVQVPVNTWEAYNAWGGHSLYDFNSVNKRRANRVSFDRPYDKGAQTALEFEIQLVRFLEREGIDVSYQTDVDTHFVPSSLLEHRLVMVGGHDEYWTKEIRDAFDKARDLGTNLAFMSSNTGYWQVRYEDDGRTIVGYKDANADPNADPMLKTVRFRDVGRPECELEGVMFFYLHKLSQPPLDYTITDVGRFDPWFAGTGFQPGDRVKGIVNYEWDELAPNPLPGCVKPGLTVLFHYDGAADGNQNADAVRYTAPSGARVFSAGAERFSWGLDSFGTDNYDSPVPADPRLQQFVRNMLNDLTRPAPPRRYHIQIMRHGVRVRFVKGPDPRIRAIEIFREAASRLVLIARSKNGTCIDHPTWNGGIVRYVGVSVDGWGVSRTLVSQPIRVRRVSQAHD